MHVIDLGIAQYLVGAVFMQLIESNFARADVPYVWMSRQANIVHLRRRMRVYYKTCRRARGTMSAIGRLTLKMLGSTTKPRLAAKAAETRNLVPLLAQLCGENREFLGDRAVHLIICCTELLRFYQTMEAEPRQMTPGGLFALQSSMSKFLVNWRAWGGHCVFKHHMAWHMVERASQHGNPRFYWTYADEQENRVMSQVAKIIACRQHFLRHIPAEGSP